MIPPYPWSIVCYSYPEVFLSSVIWRCCSGCSSLYCFLYLTLLWPLLLPLHLLQLCAPVHHQSLQWLWWFSHLCGWQHWVNLMFFYHHSWFWGMQWGVLWVSWLCSSNNYLSSRCHLRHVPTMQWVLCRWVFSSIAEAYTDSYNVW